MKKKHLITILIFCLIVISITLIYFIPKYNAYLEKKKQEEILKNAVIKVELKEDLQVSFNSKVSASNFIDSINGTITEDTVIDTKELGTKEVNFTYVNDDGIQIPYTYMVEVVDTQPPLVWLNNTYNVNVNYKGDLMEDIMCADDYDDEPDCKIIGDYDLTKVGSYKLTYEATDSSNNKTTKEFTLNVKEPTESTDVDYGYTELDYIISKYKTENTKIGIDISAWQGDVDYEAIKEAGIEFVFLRIGGNLDNDTIKDPDNFLDSTFKDNVEGFNKVGIPVGVYFFSYISTEENAIRDAKWVLEQIKGYKIELPIVYDWENWGSNYNQYHKSLYKITLAAETFLDTVSAAGYDGMLYGSINMIKNAWQPIDYPIWVAHYTDEVESYGDSYAYWQIASNGKVPGIMGYTDIDIMYIK